MYINAIIVVRVFMRGWIMIANPPIDCLIRMFNHYHAHAKQCLDLDKGGISEAGIPYEGLSLEHCYFLYDYNMQMAGIYEQAILAQL